MTESRYGDVSVAVKDYVASVEIHRPPHNFFDVQLIRDLANAFNALDEDAACRVSVLCAEGRSFCAGANFANRAATGVEAGTEKRNPLYSEAVRLFSCKKPMVGAIQGPAIGGGLGLALVPDFRVASPEARFAANFVKIGFHPGFGLTYTLPRLIGVQKANLMFLTGRRVTGEEAYRVGSRRRIGRTGKPARGGDETRGRDCRERPARRRLNSCHRTPGIGRGRAGANGHRVRRAGLADAHRGPSRGHQGGRRTTARALHRKMSVTAPLPTPHQPRRSSEF